MEKSIYIQLKVIMENEFINGDDKCRQVDYIGTEIENALYYHGMNVGLADPEKDNFVKEIIIREGGIRIGNVKF